MFSGFASQLKEAVEQIDTVLSTHRKDNETSASGQEQCDQRYNDHSDTQEQDHTVDHHGHNHPNFSHSPPGHTSTEAASGKYSQPRPDKNEHGSTFTQSIPGIDTEYRVSDCRGQKKALFIGINYTGTQAALNGCINDVHNIRRFVQERFGFKSDHCVQLTDDQEEERYMPTRANIISGMRWLVDGARPGDSLFLHYSGHGATTADEGKSQRPTRDGDEKDGQDETLVPLDYATAGMIVDDELHEILVKPLQQGVRLTAIFDCCHSGTILDLPFTYKCDGNIEIITDSHHKEMAKAIIGAGLSLKRGDIGTTIAQIKEGIRLFKKPGDNSTAQARAERIRRSDADVIQFSGCRDDQTSADANINSVATGAMSYALIKVLRENDNISYTDLLYKLRDELRDNYTQVPQMSAGRPMEMTSDFIM